MKELKPIRETPSDFDEIEDEIRALFRHEIYEPLLAILGQTPKLENAVEDLLWAIRKSRIRYAKGGFEGKFSSKISKELKALGARWDRKGSAWRVALSSLPRDVRAAVEASDERFVKAITRISHKLADVNVEKMAAKLRIEKVYEQVLEKMHAKVDTSLDGVGVKVLLSDEEKKRIAKEYTDNMRIYIQDFTRKEIQELRTKIQRRVFDGQRYEGVVRSIQRSYGVSASKAKFLARQETNILLAKFKAACYTGSGITHYKWRCVAGTAKHPVRPRHRELNDQSLRGKLFRFDDPPMMEDGKKKNPGEDYNCRCVAIPIVNGH